MLLYKWINNLLCPLCLVYVRSHLLASHSCRCISDSLRRERELPTVGHVDFCPRVPSGGTRTQLQSSRGRCGVPQRPLALVKRGAEGKGTRARQEVQASERVLLHNECGIGVGIVHEYLELSCACMKVCASLLCQGSRILCICYVECVVCVSPPVHRRIGWW